MKKTLFLSAFILAPLSVSADVLPGVATNEGGSWVWTDVVITPENQHNYLTVPGTSGNDTFSGATAAVLSVGTSHGEGTLTIDGGKLVSPNCVFIAGKGYNTPGGTNNYNNGTVTVTNGGSLTVAGRTWSDPYHNRTASGAQLSIANSTGVTGTLNITNGGQVHANALTAVGGGTATGVVNISGEGSVMDFDLRGETEANQVQVYIGYSESGKGTVNVKDGALFTTATSKVPTLTFLGVFGNATGTLNVENATADLGYGALLGYQAGTKGSINVTNGGTLATNELDVGSSGTGSVTVDATSKAEIGGLFVTNGSVDNAGILEAAVVKVTGSNKLTNSGTATVYQALTLEGSAELDGSGVVNLVERAALTNNGHKVDIEKLTLTDKARANLSSDGSGVVKVNQIVTAFNNELHATGTDASVLTNAGAAADIANHGTRWFFALTDEIANAIVEGNGTRYLTNMTSGVDASAYCHKMDGKSVWFETVSGETGTYIRKKEVVTDLNGASSATLSNTAGEVEVGETISNDENIARIVDGEEKADLYVMVETRAERTAEGNNGHVVVSVKDGSETKEYAVNNAYIGNELTLRNTDLVAAGDVSVQATVNVENSKIESTGGKVEAQGAVINMKSSSITSTMGVGTILNSVIKGTGTLTKLDVTKSELIAGNSPGKMTLDQVMIDSGTLRFYVGGEAEAALASNGMVLSLDNGPLVTSGFIIGPGTAFGGEVALELWSEESSFAYQTGRIFDKVGQGIQLFMAGDGANLNTALANVRFTLGSTFDAATTWAWDTSTLATDGFLRVVVPEPATATLSLLALVGLASRRRRKA